ncbi:MAG: cysteine desulfurase [Oscillospiraceae bacterium]|nr:cysteine desulfurase [Oscillospiraceae bacterium]MDY3219221.1 cysteine desulfurase family protein [Candidatus Fimivivens sp.]SFJ22623.1 cysteine desulfurase [Ruminococcaceae bacterium D5]GKH50177.1 cysteine desulfurase [Eubacteriales bacterium]MCI6027296.1 cysteine desulfurase [Oscillospiraceae bacterium]
MEEIYFDNAATTRTDPEVAALMTHVLCEEYGNPSSLHSRGVQAQLLIERASRQLAAALGMKRGKGRILFTSGGTEANNLALFGAAAALRRRGRQIVTTSVEHASVLESAKELGTRGFEPVFLSPGPDGRIPVDALLSACHEDTILVSMMLVNNEVGAVQPIADPAVIREIRRRSPHALIHADAVQAFCKHPFSMPALGLDMVTVSAHKIHGPKGSGALALAEGARILPQLFGGEQQNRLRPGTENVAGIAALGLAAENAFSHLEENRAAAAAVGARVRERLSGRKGIVFHSPQADCSPFLLNLSAVGYRSETLLHALAAEEIYLSSGSACSKGAKSHVLAAMGCPAAEIDSALRLSFCKYNTPEQADRFAETLQRITQTLRRSN